MSSEAAAAVPAVVGLADGDWVCAASPRPARSATAREAACRRRTSRPTRAAATSTTCWPRSTEFAYEKSMLMNVGDEKGELLDAAVRRADPRLALELGTYCGYGSLRIARAAPSARVFSVELAAANAEVARRIWAHAGVDDRVTCVVGTIGDGGTTLDALAGEHGFAAGNARPAVHRPRQERLPARPAEHPGPRLAAHGIDRGRRQRPAFPARRSTGPTCASSRASCGTPSNTRRTSSTRRWSPTWCWSRSI